MTSHLARVRTRLSLHAHRPVRGLLAGEYASMQTGRGMEFNDLREYVRGDDVKDLDWKASARSRTLLVKRYVAVRKHTVLLVVSTGRSMAGHHAVGVPKRDLAVLVAGLVGWLAVRHGDLVGVAHGDADGCGGLPPRTGELHLERCLAAVHDATTAESAPSDLVGLLRHVARTVRRRTILLVVCDDDEAGPDLVAALRRLVVQHEVLVASVSGVDPTAVGRREAAAFDLESARALPAWLREDPLLREELDRATATAERSFHDALVALGVVHEQVADHDGAVRSVLRLLERHRHVRRR